MITLNLRGNVWTAAFTGEDERHIRDLFGTNEIPTPYTNEADPALVHRAIATRNARHTVVFGCSTCGQSLALWNEDRTSPCFYGHPITQDRS